MIKINGVSYSYKTKTDEIHVLDDINLNIDKGEYVAFIGPSGCGKTTLLHLIAGLKKSQTGKLLINSVNSEEAIAHNQYSIIFQEVALLDWLNVKQNVELPIKINPELKYIETDEILKQVGLLKYKKLYPNELSGGMKTRTGIARSLTANTPVLLMDECFASLDEVLRENMNNFLLEILSKIRRTLIIITHSIREAVFIADRVIVFSNKPSKIIGDVKIDIPRPRSIDDIENNEYTKYRKDIRKILNQASTY